MKNSWGIQLEPAGAVQKHTQQWASSTGIAAMSKFKLRLPAQWAVGTHLNGPRRMKS